MRAKALLVSHPGTGPGSHIKLCSSTHLARRPSAKTLLVSPKVPPERHLGLRWDFHALLFVAHDPVADRSRSRIAYSYLGCARRLHGRHARQRPGSRRRPVASATVVVAATWTGTRRSAMSDEDGRFVVELLRREITPRALRSRAYPRRSRPRFTSMWAARSNCNSAWPWQGPARP